MSSDHFYDDLKRAEKLERTIHENIRLRSEQVAKGQSTGGVSAIPLSILSFRPTTR